MLQFQYAKVSENNSSFNSYRGIKVLSSLFHKVLKESSKDHKSLYPIHLVSSVPGHLAVSFHDGRQFVVFDAVPHQLRLSNIEQMKLQRFVLKEINDYLKNILAMKTLSHVIHLRFLTPSKSQSQPSDLKTKNNEQKQEQKPPPITARKLQLLAIHSDGGIIIWNWNQIRYLWQYKIRKILPSPLSDSESRLTYMNNTNNKLYEKSRPGILVFCSVITSPSHLIKIPYLNQTKSPSQSQAEQTYIDAFENLLYPQQNVFIKNTQSHASHAINHQGSLYFLMIDYMMGDEHMTANTSIYNIHRYLLNKNFPGIKTKKYISTRFIISRVRLDVDYKNINTPIMMGGTQSPSQNMDQSKFADFRILMDGLEEIDFWTEYYADKEEKKDEEESDEVDRRRRVILIVENIWTTRYGFIIEITVRRNNKLRKMTDASLMSSVSDTSSEEAYDVDLSEICIEKRLLYYVSPFMNEMIRIPFPCTDLSVNQYNKMMERRQAKDIDDDISLKKRKNNVQEKENERMDGNVDVEFISREKQEIIRFAVGQHGTTKQLLLWDRFDNSFYILDENQLPKSSLSEYLYSYKKNLADQLEKHSAKLSPKTLKSLKPKFDLPFGHFSDKSRRIEWKYICRFDLPNESFYDPRKNIHNICDNTISKKYKQCNEKLKIFGYHDWICINITHDVYYIHLTNIVLHRRYLFHQYTHYKKQQNKSENENESKSESESGNGSGIKLQFPSPIYLSALYKEINPSIPQRHRSFNIKQTTQRRRLFSHEWSYYDNEVEIVEENEHKMESEREILSECKDRDLNDNEWKEDDHEILACAVSVLPADVENTNNNYFIIDDFGICTRDSIFRLNIHGLHEQVEAVNSCYESCQSILGGLNLLSRWGQTSLIARSKYLTDFLYQQSLFSDCIKSQQIKEALKIAPFPLLVALLYKYPQFDSLLLRHYQRTRDDFPKFTFNYGRIFGKKVMQNILYYMDYIYKNQAPLPILNSGNKQPQTVTNSDRRPTKFIAQDLAILSGEVHMQYENETNVMDEQTSDEEDDLLVDMDEIRTLISSDSLSDLNLLEFKLKLNGIRSDPFDPATFKTNAQFLCRILLLPASFRSNHECEITTPLNLLASLCRFYDLIYPVATFRLIQLLCHYQGTSSKKIALSALQGLADVKHGLSHIVKEEEGDTIIFNKKADICNKGQFDLFEERIVSRVILCKIAHRYYEMLDNLLMAPLTLSRLNNAISTAKRFNQRLSDIQKVAIFKRLLSAWIRVKMRQYHQGSGGDVVAEEEKKDLESDDDVDGEEEEEEEENVDINSDWIVELRPDGYNGFHFMKHIIEEISNRKEERIKKMLKNVRNKIEVKENKMKLNTLLKGEIPILAGKNDIPVCVLRPVLMFFASELHPHR